MTTILCSYKRRKDFTEHKSIVFIVMELLPVILEILLLFIFLATKK
jgi:hypothetical protein